MEEAPGNGKESSHCAHASEMNDLLLHYLCKSCVTSDTVLMALLAIALPMPMVAMVLNLFFPYDKENSCIKFLCNALCMQKFVCRNLKMSDICWVFFCECVIIIQVHSN